MSQAENRRPEIEKVLMRSVYQRITKSVRERFGKDVGELDQLTLVSVRRPRVSNTESPINSLTFASKFGFVRLDEWSTEVRRLGEATIYAQGIDGKTRGKGAQLLTEAEDCFQGIADKQDQPLFVLYNPNQYSVNLMSNLAQNSKKYTGAELRNRTYGIINTNFTKCLEDGRVFLDVASFYFDLERKTLLDQLDSNSVGVYYEPISRGDHIRYVDESIHDRNF